MNNRGFSLKRPEQLLLLLAAAVVSYQTFLPPVVGLANDGDFGKIAGVFRLGSPLEGSLVNRFSYTTYVFDQKFYYRSDFASSESILLKLALDVNSVFSKTGTFDLRVMGAVHAAVFLLSVYLLLPLVKSLSQTLRLLILSSALLMFTDVMYISYFNSLYMDTAAFLFLLLATVLFLRALFWRKQADCWSLVVSLVFLITSKTQHYPLGLLAAVLLAWKGRLLTPTFSRSFAVLSTFLMLAATIFSYRASAPIYPTQGCYTVIFFRLLPKANNAQQDLVDLGLDGTYQQFIGSNAYSENSGLRDPEFVSTFARKISYPRLGWFFVTHPEEALRMIIYSMGQAGYQRPDFGNFDVSAGQPPFAQSHSFAIWSKFKAREFAERGLRYLSYSVLLIFGVPVLAVVRRHSLPQGIPEGIVALSAIAAVELLVASLADAMDYQRHFFIFNTLTDLLLLSAAILLALAAEPFWAIALRKGMTSRERAS